MLDEGSSSRDATAQSGRTPTEWLEVPGNGGDSSGCGMSVAIGRKPLTEEQKRLVEDNLDFAHWSAWRLHSSGRAGMLSIEDCVSAAYLGLCLAARRYGHRGDNKAKFTVYAWHWIFQAVTRSSYQDALIAVPEYLLASGSFLRASVATLDNATRKDTRPDDSAEMLDVIDFLSRWLNKQELEVVRLSVLEEVGLKDVARMWGTSKTWPAIVRKRAFAKLRVRLNPTDGRRGD